MYWLGRERPDGRIKGLPIVMIDLGTSYVTTDVQDPTTIVIGTRHQVYELRVCGDLLHALSQLNELASRCQHVVSTITGSPTRG